MYIVYTKQNLADTSRDSSRYSYETIGKKENLEDAISIANSYIKTKFFKTETKLEKGEGNILYEAMDFCSYPKQIIIEMEEVKKEEPREFESGAKRDSNFNKPFVHSILGYTRLRFGYHMNMGARKYGDANWLKGITNECYLESVDRHLALYLEGDRSEDHLSAIIFGIQGCMLNEKNEGVKVDQYYKK